MDKISKFLDDMMSDEEFLSKPVFRQKIYKDEPIIRRGSQLPNSTPDKITAMRELASNHSVLFRSNSLLFYRQAKFMEDYEDDFPYDGIVEKYYPTYQFMSTAQLRGYFTWRTKVRHGEFSDTSDTFASMYAYELINGIGAPTAEECFEKLKLFLSEYTPKRLTTKTYFNRWLTDMVLYYSLGEEKLRELPEGKTYCRLERLSRPDDYSREEVTEALLALSSYSVSVSAFYRAYPDDMEEAVYEIFRELFAHYAKKTKSFAETYFGKGAEKPYELFDEAVFYSPEPAEEKTVEVTPLLRYTNRDHIWYKYSLLTEPDKNGKLGALIKNADAVMREVYQFPNKLTLPAQTALVKKITERVADEVYRKKLIRKRPPIEIDLSSLESIREAADETRQKLILPEEAEETEETEAIAEPAVPAAVFPEEPEKIPVEATAFSDDGMPPLTEEERYMLCCLIEGKDYTKTLRAKGKMPSVVAESINEKLFEIFADTVIGFDGDRAYLTEDYEEEIKETYGGRNGEDP